MKHRGRTKRITRLQKAEARFRSLVNEHRATGQLMVVARTEFLEADAEEKAKLAIRFPDDKAIVANSNKANDDLLGWRVKIDGVETVKDEVAVNQNCKRCSKKLETDVDPFCSKECAEAHRSNFYTDEESAEYNKAREEANKA